VSLERMSPKSVAPKSVALGERMSLERVPSIHHGSLRDVSPLPVKSADEIPEVVKKDAMQALRVKSREKGSRKRTCPKVDMPKSR
jgi:hypothetical protein